MLQLKRIYDPVSVADGYRILIDRLWPRGVSKERAAVDLWAKDISPSDQLRKDSISNLIDYEETKARYLAELDDNPATPAFLELIENKLKDYTITLLYSSKDTEQNHGIILMSYLNDHGLK